MKGNQTHNKLMGILIAVIMLFTNLTAIASVQNYTIGEREHYIDLIDYDYANFCEYDQYSDSVNFFCGSKVTYNLYLPFNASRISFFYTAQEDTQITVTCNEYKKTITLNANGYSGAVSFDSKIRKGDVFLSISFNNDISIRDIKFDKESKKVSSYRAQGDIGIELSAEQELLQTAVILHEVSSVIKINGASRYINYDDMSEKPMYINGKLCLPINTLARALNYYYEVDFERRYFILRNDVAEFVYKDSKLLKQNNFGEYEEIYNVAEWKNETAYLPFRYFAEVAGKTVGYKNGLVVADYKNKVEEILEGEYFDEIYNEITMFNIDVENGRTYYVSQQNGNSKNDGSKEKPFQTIKQAADIAQAGDTVIIDSGIYRETLKPANNGTEDKPILFKASEGANVVISAADILDSSNVIEENGLTIYDLPIDLGDGRNLIFRNNEVIREARYPNEDTKKVINENFKKTLGSLWPTTGEFRVSEENDSVIISDTELNQEKDFWAGGTIVGLFGSGWSMSTGKIISSEEGKLILGDKTKKFWFSDKMDSDFAYITGCINAIDIPWEWSVYNSKLYIMLPDGVHANNVLLEAKQRQKTIDLSQKQYIQVKDINTFGGGITCHDAIMCTINGGEHEYISHYTYSNDQHGGFIDDENKYDYNGAPPRGEVGIYLGGSDNAVINTKIKWSAAAGIILMGKYGYVENNFISDTGYGGSYLNGIYISGEAWGEHTNVRGGHGIYNNTVKNTSRAGICMSSVETDWRGLYGNTPYLALDIAYNDIYNTNIMARDTGTIYFHGVAMGRDELYSKVHHNVVWNGMSVSSGTALSANCGIYFDNYVQNVQCYENIILETDISKFDTDLYVQAEYLFPSSFATVDAWNNVIEKKVKNDKSELCVSDYPNNKYFKSGCEFGEINQISLDNYTLFENKIYSVNDAESAEGVTIKKSQAIFSDDNQWIGFKNVNFGSENNAVKIIYSGDCYNSGDVIEVGVGENISTAKKVMTTLNSNSSELVGKNEVVLYNANAECVQNVFINMLDHRSAKINAIIPVYTENKNALLSFVYAGKFNEQLSGNDVSTRTPPNSNEKMVICPRPGMSFLYKDFYLPDTAKYLTVSAGTVPEHSDTVINIRLDSPEGEIVGTYTTYKEDWYDYSSVDVEMIKPLSPGYHDLYVTIEGKGTCNIYWFGFKNTIE